MKSGLLLTLKELIKLGVIKIKKKRKRRSYQKTINTGGQSQVPPLGEQKYNAFVTTSSPNPVAYSDALRLRDENRNFDTRLLEYKNQQQEQKLLLDDQQQQQQQLQQRQLQIQDVINQGIPVINSLALRLRNQGFADDDNVDVIETYGSSSFKTQQDIADPELRELPPPPPQPVSPRPTLKEMEQMTQMTGFESEYEPETGQEMQTIQPKLKRGRGRPRKIK